MFIFIFYTDCLYCIVVEERLQDTLIDGGSTRVISSRYYLSVGLAIAIVTVRINVTGATNMSGKI